MDEGAFDEAVSTLERTIAQMPAYAPAYVLLARAYEAQERWAEALTAWQNARFFAPNSPVVETGLLRVLDRYEASEDEDGNPTSGSPSDPMDRLADELIATIRERNDTEPPAAAAASETIADESIPNDASSREEDVPARTEPAPDGDGAPSGSDQAPSPLEELMLRTPDPDRPLPPDIEDLDRLIDELENARIDPQPDLEDVPPPDLDHDIDDMVSETLARIYVSQKQYAEAARVYTRLAAQEPERADEYLDKAATMRLRASEQNEGR